MDWNKLLQLAAESLATAAGLVVMAAAGWLMPLVQHWLVVKVGEAEAAQIENGFELAVRVTESQLGLITPEAKKAFAVKWAQEFFDEHNLKVDTAKVGDRIEAALLAQKMAGLSGPSVAQKLARLSSGPAPSGAILPMLGSNSAA